MLISSSYAERPKFVHLLPCHTNATLMVANGIPIKVVSDRLGHASVTTTSNFYLHMIQSADDVAANTLNDILSAV